MLELFCFRALAVFVMQCKKRPASSAMLSQMKVSRIESTKDANIGEHAGAIQAGVNPGTLDLPVKRPVGRPRKVKPWPSTALRTPQPWDPIVEALRETLGPDVLAMVRDALPDTLGVPKDERHPFEDRLLVVIESELQKIESGLAELETKGDHTECAVFVADVEAREAALAASKVHHAQHKAHLACLENAVASAAAALTARRSLVDQDAVNAARKRVRLERQMEVYATLKTGTADRSDADDFIRELTELGFDAGLLTSIQSCLTKMPDERGHFDTRILVLLGVELEQVARSLAEREGDVNSQLMAVEAAKAVWAQARDERDDGAVAESDSAVAVESASRDLDRARAALADFKGEKSRSFQEVAAFRAGPLFLFKRLRDATRGHL